jgi:hypothetical protein
VLLKVSFVISPVLNLSMSMVSVRAVTKLLKLSTVPVSVSTIATVSAKPVADWVLAVAASWVVPPPLQAIQEYKMRFSSFSITSPISKIKLFEN